VTQVIGFRDSSSAQPKCLDLLRSVRRLQETLLHGGYAPSYHPVVDLRTGHPIGYEAIARAWPAGQKPPEADRMVLAAQIRLAARLREMFCLAAAEDCVERPGQKLFLPLECSEVDLDTLEGLLGRLGTVLPDLSSIVFEVPDSDVNDVPYFHRWHARIRECGAGLCYREFAAGRARLEEHRKTPPNFIKLSASMVRGVAQDASRRAACETLIRACREVNCQPIAAGIDNVEHAELFRELGCPLGQGPGCPKEANHVDHWVSDSSVRLAREPEPVLS
jgi:EAL domain-containing protein (putative c-di-GMP-specific phosphodiesterase class I)